MQHGGHGATANPTKRAPGLGRRVLRGGLRGVFGLVMGHLLVLGQFSVLGRYLSLSEFGAFVAALGLTQLGLTCATQGIPVALVRFVGARRDPERDPTLRSLLRRSVAAVLLGGLFMAGIVWNAGDVLVLVQRRQGTETAVQMLRPYLPLVGTWLLVGSFVHWFRGLFQGLKWFAWSTFFEKGVVPAGLLLGIGVCWVLGLAPPGQRLVAVLWSYWLALVLAVVLGTAVLAPWWRQLVPGRQTWPWKELLGTAWPLGVGNMLAMLATNGLLWWLGLVANGEQVAYFGASQRLGALVTLPLVFSAIVVPAFVSELHAAGRLGEMERLVRTVAFIGGVPGLVAGAIIWLLAPWVLGVVFGPGFEGAAGALRWLLVGYGVQLVTGPTSLALAMTGHQRALLVASVVTLLAAAGLASWTMRSGSAEGAAQALAAYLGGGRLVAWTLVRRFVGIGCHMRWVGPREARRWVLETVRTRTERKAERGALGGES